MSLSKFQTRQVILTCDKKHERPTGHCTNWFEVALNEKWTVAYRLAIQHGRQIVQEIRIFPSESGPRDRGEWSGCRFGEDAKVPRGGLKSAMLKALRLGSYKAQRQQLLEWFQKGGTKEAPGLGTLPATRGSGGRGRKPLDDIEYCRIAALYVAALDRKDPSPVQTVFKRLRRMSSDVTPAIVRDRLHRARKRGFLTLSGFLTDSAKAIIKQHSTKGGKRHAKR